MRAGALAIAVFGLALTTPALADGYLAMEGITPPPSQASGGWAGGGAGANNPSWLPVSKYKIAFATGPANAMNVITVTRQVDASSNAIREANGKSLKKAVLDVPDTNNLQIVYELENAVISGYAVSSGSNGAPMETFTLSSRQLDQINKTSQPTINGSVLAIPELAHAPALPASVVNGAKGW
jgi:hypothetical protein